MTLTDKLARIGEALNMFDLPVFTRNRYAQALLTEVIQEVKQMEQPDVEKVAKAILDSDYRFAQRMPFNRRMEKAKGYAKAAIAAMTTPPAKGADQ